MRWRALRAEDLLELHAIANQVHLDHPEDAQVFAERLMLYPEGCLALEDSDTAISGYVLSHPWHLMRPPALNVLLGEIPAAATTYYIHDIALLPRVRGTGAALEVAQKLIDHANAKKLQTVSLVAVNSSMAFWKKLGFEIGHDTELDRRLESYVGKACYMIKKWS
jgi:ribosomal protein S18 acetylase RimI-like enzyme